MAGSFRIAIKPALVKPFSLFAAVLLFVPVAQGQVERKRLTGIMGSRFELTFIGKDSATAEQYIDTAIAEIRRIEYLISEWIDTTQVSRVNQNAGIRPVKVAPELFELTKRAIAYSEMSNGAFDISFAAMDKIWVYDGSMEKLPSGKQIKHAIRNVGYKNIILNDRQKTIFLAKKGMKIGFGSIGKSYAVDKAKALLTSRGIPVGMINAAGDIGAWGTRPKGAYWNIGIADPFTGGELLGAVRLSNESIVTSGTYEKYVEFNGRRYSHIINPKTGYPSTGLVSVTILGPQAEFGNALSTSVMVLGLKKGIRLLKKYPQYQYLIATDKGRLVQSAGLKVNKID